MGGHHSRKRGRSPHGSTQGRYQRDLVRLERTDNRDSGQEHYGLLPHPGPASRNRVCSSDPGGRSRPACPHHVPRSYERLRPGASEAMRLRIVTTVMLLLCLVKVASAHRLDEYLQATIISVDKDHIQASMRMIPGVAVSSSVIASIDSNGDGVISPAEQRAYAERVLGDLSLAVDGKSVKPKLVSADFPQIELMREGLGEIHIDFTADLPPGGSNRRLILENHHQNQNAAYLVNCLAPRDRDIRIVAQNRNEQQ